MPQNKKPPPIKATTQDFIEIDEIKDDIVLMRDRAASLIIEVGTVKYWLLAQEEQDSIISAYGKLLNSLSFPVQILIVSKKTDISSYLNLIDEKIKNQSADFMKKRLESYKNFIKTTVKKSEVLEKSFYFAIPFSPYEMGAVKSIQKLTNDYIIERAKLSLYPKKDHLLRLLNKIGLKATVLQKQKIVELFYSLYNSNNNQNNLAQIEAYGDKLNKGGFGIKDLIAPSYAEIDFNHIKIDNKFYRTLYVAGYPRYVSPNWLHSLISFDRALYTSMFIYPTESKDVMEDLKRKIAEMEATIENDIKVGKIIDPSVQVALDDAMSLQAELAKGAERFFQFGLYITIPANSLEELDKITKQVELSLSSLLIISRKATLQMEEGYKSTLPLFYDKLGVWRNMDSTSLAMTFPFSTASLTKNEGVLYGLNEHDGSLIIFDRFTLENANSVILGKSGGGKSFLVKLETLRLLMMGIDVIIIDPENEYKKLAESFGGEFVEFSSSSKYKINPFDLTVDDPEPDELQNKILDLHSLMRVIMGDLTPAQDALLDRALVTSYKLKNITQDPKTFKNESPLLEDLYKVFLGMETDESREMADRLEKFVKGSASGIFNERSNFDIKNKFTVFGIRDLEENLRPVAMYIVLDFIWNRVRRLKRKRVLIVDEAWYLIKNKDSGSYLFSFAKRARKYSLGLTTITQDVEDFIATNEGRAIITNSSLQILLKQSTAAIDQLTKTFYLTKGERQFLLSAGIGEGLFFAGQSHVGFKVISSDEEKSIIE